MRRNAVLFWLKMSTLLSISESRRAKTGELISPEDYITLMILSNQLSIICHVFRIFKCLGRCRFWRGKNHFYDNESRREIGPCTHSSWASRYVRTHRWFKPHSSRRVIHTILRGRWRHPGYRSWATREGSRNYCRRRNKKWEEGEYGCVAGVVHTQQRTGCDSKMPWAVCSQTNMMWKIDLLKFASMKRMDSGREVYIHQKTALRFRPVNFESLGTSSLPRFRYSWRVW